MRFIIGLLLGLGVGFAAALLLAPEKGRRQREAEPPGDEGFGEDHDTMAGLRRAMQGLQEQAQEAWKEARQAAEEAEKEMRARYERTVSKRRR
jgi:gas vesicle protein